MDWLSKRRESNSRPDLSDCKAEGAANGRALFAFGSTLDSLRETRQAFLNAGDAMPKLSTRSTTNRPSGGERVFSDELGRLWSAANTGNAVIFTCITDGRQSGRAIAIDYSMMADDVGDETLRAWLSAAPRIGRLT